MYSYLSGSILSIDDGKISILVAGTGLGLEVLPTPLLLSKASIGETIEAPVHHHITDISEALFAFASFEEKRFFRKLLKVDGVGGKTALSLLGLGISPLAKAIESGDEKTISSVPGIGKKTALKIIVELKSEVSGEDIARSGEASEKNSKPSKTQKQKDSDPIITTLVSMGYDRKLVEQVLESLPEEGDTQSRTIAALRALAK